jgi:chemotaxis protein MotB
MARKKKNADHGGGHGWYVTFADLMALLMAFFVVVAASSSQDKEKMATAIGSIRDAFGTQTDKHLSGGVMEIEGLPVRGHTKNVANVAPADATQQPGPMSERLEGGPLMRSSSAASAQAAATLRQALQDMPEINEISRHLMVEEREDGIALHLMDQDGRSMFADGSRQVYERTRRALIAVSGVLRDLSQNIAISGHTGGNEISTPGYGPWDLSADRANAVRQVLEEGGVPRDRFQAVTGRAATEPLFPDNPYLAANRRVTILLINEPPAVPANRGL